MGGSIEYSPRDDGETGSVFTVALVFDVPLDEESHESSVSVMSLHSLPKGKEEYGCG